MAEIIIRSARPTDQDAKAYAELVAIAADDAFPTLFGPRGQTIIRQLFHHPKHTYSYDKTYFALVDNEIAGLMSGVAWQAFQTQEASSTWLLLRQMKWQAWRYLWGVLQLSLVGLRLGRCYEGEYYIQFLAVYSQFRQRGLGQQLLAQAEVIGRLAGCHQLALDVDAGNRAALSLYRKAGYQIVASFPSQAQQNIGRIYRMVKPL